MYGHICNTSNPTKTLRDLHLHIYRPQRSCEGYVFTPVCLSTGGGASSLLGDSGRFEGGAPGTCLPTAQNFLNFMQFFAKFGKIICWRPLQRVGAPSYGESWICPWGGLVPGGSAPRGVCYWGGVPGPREGVCSQGECLDLVVSGGIPACTEADPPADSYFCRQYASYWNACLLDSIKTSLRIPTQYKDPPHIKFIITTSTLRC